MRVRCVKGLGTAGMLLHELDPGTFKEMAESGISINQRSKYDARVIDSSERLTAAVNPEPS